MPVPTTCVACLETVTVLVNKQFPSGMTIVEPSGAAVNVALNALVSSVVPSHLAPYVKTLYTRSGLLNGAYTLPEIDCSNCPVDVLYRSRYWFVGATVC